MVFLANMYTAGITTGFGELAMEFYVGNAKLVNTISYPVLALGVGNVFWTPTAVCLGKRPTIIVALMVFLACTIWSIKATTFNSLVASRVVACFAGGSIDSLGPAIVAGEFSGTLKCWERLCFSSMLQISIWNVISPQQWLYFLSVFLVVLKLGP